ncbi:MAG TPA: tRNA preQ1(34) S-adenosylmethionine ribosyltransferase-isomerase QueA [Candidatus Saccharimonadales bacterium]|nr:tRNA preQ1(34) S-adenosylmethionine ribosyltransferase-isomerase QueA [Candidatus Saccharimonadales bacterium]
MSCRLRQGYRLAVRASDFHFDLPEAQIAQFPVARRDQSRLLHLDRTSGRHALHQFPDILRFLCEGDVLVLNDSKVIPARLRGLNEKTGGKFELLLLEEISANDWWALMKPGKRASPGTRISLLGFDGQPSPFVALVMEYNEQGHRRLQFSARACNVSLPAPNILDHLNEIGEIPLPPYIRRHSSLELKADAERYQTVFALEKGSVAAPTAGLHFTPELLEKIKGRGVQVERITLHVGLGTFAPVKSDDLSAHTMHEERFFLPETTAQAINLAKSEGRRIVAIGTTSTRLLESVAAQHGGKLVAGGGRTRIFIHPPHQFKIIDALLTNFHLPRSTLLMLVSAFAAPGETRGRELVLEAYAAAIREGFRFFSYGDAMFIT